MPRPSKIEQIKERLAKIADQDTELVFKTNEAMIQASKLGYSHEQIQGLLDNSPMDLVNRTPGKSFWGFESRQQATLALFGIMAKKDRPGALGDVHERVVTLIKNQEAPRAAATIGLAIISIPQMTGMGEIEGEEPVKRFKRMKSGKLREIQGREAAIEVEAVEDSESTQMIRARTKAEP